MGNRSSRPPIGGVDLGMVRQLQHEVQDRQALFMAINISATYGITALLLELGATPIECDRIIETMVEGEEQVPVNPSGVVLHLNNKLRHLRGQTPEPAVSMPADKVVEEQDEAFGPDEDDEPPVVSVPAEKVVTAQEEPF